MALMTTGEGKTQLITILIRYIHRNRCNSMGRDAYKHEIALKLQETAGVKH